MDRTAAFYSQPSYVQRGGGLPVYSGSRRQRGGSILGALKSFIMPIFQTVKRTALKQGKQAAVKMAKDVAVDAITGRNIGNSIKTRGINSIKQLGKNTLHAAADAIGGTSTSVTRRKRKAPATLPGKRRKKRKVVKNF